MTESRVERTEPAIEATGFRLSWGGIFAGFFVAIGLTAWDPARPGGVRGDEVAAGIGI
jgi:hypothetical protein